MICVSADRPSWRNRDVTSYPCTEPIDLLWNLCHIVPFVVFDDAENLFLSVCRTCLIVFLGCVFESIDRGGAKTDWGDHVTTLISRKTDYYAIVLLVATPGRSD